MAPLRPQSAVQVSRTRASTVAAVAFAVLANRRCIENRKLGMKPSQIVLPVLAVAVASLVVASIASESVGYRVGEKWRQLTGDRGQACLDFERQVLLDPLSARLVGLELTVPGSSEVRIKYLAKNSFGAYVPGEAVCVVSSGVVDQSATAMARRNEEIRSQTEAIQASTAKKERILDCLKRKIQAMREGSSQSEDCERVQ